MANAPILQLGTTPNYANVTIDGIRYYFSYQTCIAFTVVEPDTRARAKASRREYRTVVRQNMWGPTTGKHLNMIDGGGAEAKASRLDGEAFTKALDAL